MRRIALAAFLALLAFPAAAPGKALELGLQDDPNEASGLGSVAPFAYRYQYLSGDIRAASGWRNWNPGGRFVTNYVSESKRARVTPVFSYYTIQQSEPGLGAGNEAAVIRQNLGSPAFVKAWLGDIELALKRIGNSRAIFQVEPDMWGWIQQRNRRRAPPNVRRVARKIVKIRNRVAPKVQLAYPVSIWGSGPDVVYDNTPLGKIPALARRSAGFYRSLGARFDLVFGEMDDRDSGFNEVVLNDRGRSWWTQTDYERHVRFFSNFTKAARRNVIIWQVPLGNSNQDNSNKHWRDDKVETLLGDPKRKWLERYAGAGVIAFIFGAGIEGGTTDESDGGLFHRLAKRYYDEGPVQLP
jgi:hypothetical protein